MQASLQEGKKTASKSNAGVGEIRDLLERKAGHRRNGIKTVQEMRVKRKKTEKKQVHLRDTFSHIRPSFLP